ncbi:MAG: carbohydrate-binding family 9-like protein, partial [Flavisolibacter sp.]
MSGISQQVRPVYKVKKLKKPMSIDGNWDKRQWRTSKVIEITNFMGQVPPFQPSAFVKMMYDENNLYVIFKVKDCFIRSITEDYNGPVSTDACVEFFFAPDTSLPERYFNLEINAGGTPLMAYHIFPKKEYQKLSIEDLKKIE